MLFLSAKLAWFIHLSFGSQMGKIKKTSFIYNQFLYSRKNISAFAYKKMLKCTSDHPDKNYVYLAVGVDCWSCQGYSLLFPSFSQVLELTLRAFRATSSFRNSVDSRSWLFWLPKLLCLFTYLLYLSDVHSTLRFPSCKPSKVATAAAFPWLVSFLTFSQLAELKSVAKWDYIFQVTTGYASNFECANVNFDKMFKYLKLNDWNNETFSGNLIDIISVSTKILL